MPEQTKAETTHPWAFDRVLRRELAYVRIRRQRLGQPRAKTSADTTALCLSGGGVRSASFCLGVVRGLARSGILKNFDYLSTVSGGGFTGGFLSRWVKEDGYRAVEQRLGSDLEFAQANSPLAHLRKYISYLTPRIGLFSLDSISGAGLFIRNLFINWLIIAPFIMAVLALVLCGQAAFQWLALLQDYRMFFSLLMLPGVTLCGYAISYALFRRPGLSGTTEDPPFDKLQRNYSGPVFFGSLAIAAAIVTAKSSSAAYQAINLFIAIGCLLLLALSQVMTAIRREDFSSARALVMHVAKTVWPLLAQCAAFILVGMLLLDQLLKLFMPEQPPSDYGPPLRLINAETMANVYYMLGPLIFTLTLYLSEIIYVAVRGNPKTANYEREWLARSTGALFGAPLAWAFLVFSVIYGPALVSALQEALIGAQSGSGLVDAFGATTLSGIIVALLSRRKDAVALVKQGQETWRQLGARWLLAIALPVFIFLLIVLLTAAVQRLAFVAFDYFSFSAVRAFLVVGAALALFGFLFDLMIPTNVFNLHAIYRNRLVRSFVGAANPDRTGGEIKQGFLNYFTADNVGLHELTGTAKAGGVPPQLHILNMALNVPGSADIALQERKAHPFSASAIAVGSRALPHADPADTSPKPRQRRGSYRPAKDYASDNGLPLSLGSAIAISGAAVSPNMGYHSSPALSVLLTLFNLRLGIWLGNPSLVNDTSYRRDGPQFNISTLFIESVGRANEDRKFLHLSDGGHFDNLGLYEMLARRCRLIVVVDAGCDPETGLSDLGIAQRLAKLDLGAEIRFDDGSIKDIRDSRKRVATGRILYAKTAHHAAGDGVIVYVKPRRLADDSAIISSYGARARDFPHEPTSDQWFTESQFAAYLAMGERAAAEIPETALAALRERASPPRKPGKKGRRP